MNYNPGKHHRRSIRLKCRDYSQPGAYFVTICTKDRECVFGDVIERRMHLNRNGKNARDCWFELFDRYQYVKPDVFIVMPNHVHGIIIIQHQTGAVQSAHQFQNAPAVPVKSNQCEELILMKTPLLSLGKIIRNYKSMVSRRIRENSSIFFQWQRNYHDTILFSDKDLGRARYYIRNNPALWEQDGENPANFTNRLKPTSQPKGL